MLKTRIINVQKAKARFSDLLRQLEEKGGRIIISRDGKPVAELVPHKRVNPVRRQLVLSQINICYDPVEALANDQ